MLINEYINQLFGTNFSSELNKEAIKYSMAFALVADGGCLIGQCHPNLWNFIYKMNETNNYEINEDSYERHNSDNYFFKAHLLKAFELSENLKSYNSEDENLYILACNPSEDKYYIGCSLKAYFLKFAKYFNEVDLYKELVYAVHRELKLYSNEVRSLVKDYLGLTGNGNHEIYLCVDQHLKGYFVSPNPVYPFHHMWNESTPWRFVDEKTIQDLKELKLLPMKYNGEFVVENEKKNKILNIKIVKGNIIDFDSDVLVNAANETLAPGAGVCGAIFDAAGYTELSNACNEIGYCKTGNSVITAGFNLKSKYIIHTVGPVYRDDSSSKYLKKAYYNTLKLADNYCCKTVAIPSISTGIYGYPVEKAARIAIDQIINYHSSILEEVNVVCFDDKTYDIYEKELKRQIRLNKIKGCLLGGAMGDALGYPVEFYSYEQIQKKYGQMGIQEYELTNGKAIISDDTQMSLFTAMGLLFWNTRMSTRGLSSNPSSWIYEGYLDWLETQGYKPERGTFKSVSWIKKIPELNKRRAPGGTCISALLSGEKGTIEKRINNSKGCGGVMRVAPLGLCVNNHDPEGIALECADAAAITHGHDLGFIPAAMLGHIIQSIMNMNDTVISLKPIINNSLEKICNIYKESKHIKEFRELIEKAINLSKTPIEPIDAIKQLGEGWVAEEALAIAIYSVLVGYDFERTLIIAVNHDGDSDSTGSIAGNIAGAWYGYNNIPLKFKDNLELKNVMKEISEDLCNGCPFDEFSEKIDVKWAKKYM